MRKTIIAATAAALLALSACGSDDGGIDVEGAKDAASSQFDKATDAAGSAAADATGTAGSAENGADGEGADATGANGEGADGASADAGEMGTIALPDGSEVQAPAAIAQKYEEIQAADGHLGAPIGEAQEVAGGQMLEFEGGTIVQNADGQAFLVQGEILKEYVANGGPAGELGFPTTDETPQDGGFISTFANGDITWDIASEQATVEQN